MLKCWGKCFFLLILVTALPIIALPVSARVDYQINITQPIHHLAEVTIKFPKGHEQLELFLPVWRTGNYKVINQANGIRKFRVKGNDDSHLNWQRVSKSQWNIDNPSKESVIVKYELYANELAKRSRHIDSTHAYLDATATFMYAKNLMSEIHSVKVIAPKGWKSYSGLSETGEHEFVAQSYHQLASSPIETGISEYYEFTADGRNYQLVIWGKGNYDGQKMADDLQKLAPKSQSIWRGYPYKKYVFIVHATSGASGATEHLNSTVIQRPRFSFAPRKDYLKYFLRTAAHELVHTWNVKAYRPQELVPYDYQQENYSQLLWVAEGSTSYFQEQLLLMAKLQTVKEFLTELASRIEKFKRRPGRLQQSISEASYEKWIAQGGDYAENHSVNIYSEGFIASWLLDAKILDDTKNQKNYRQLHAAIYDEVDPKNLSYQQYLAIPYSENTLKKIAFDFTGKDYNSWWENNIEKPFSIDFDNLLEKAGLQFKRTKSSSNIAWTGFKVKEKSGFAKLTQVEMNSPAWHAGLTIGDYIVAFNKIKITESNIRSQLESFKPGDTVEVAFFRNDSLQSTALNLGRIPKDELKIELVDNPSESQKSYFKAWLGIDYPENLKQEDNNS